MCSFVSKDPYSGSEYCQTFLTWYYLPVISCGEIPRPRILLTVSECPVQGKHFINWYPDVYVNHKNCTINIRWKAGIRTVNVSNPWIWRIFSLRHKLNINNLQKVFRLNIYNDLKNTAPSDKNICTVLVFSNVSTESSIIPTWRITYLQINLTRYIRYLSTAIVECPASC